MCAEKSTSSVRLKEERERLGFQQKEVYSRIDVSRGTYKSYEEGGTSPTAEHLRVLSTMGFDVGYIVTGQRGGGPRPLDQSVLDTLESRGISIDEDKLFGARVVSFSSAGMAWMLNYIEIHQYFSPALSWGLLSGLASFEPEASRWRPLRIKASGLPVGGCRTYFGYFFYLDGSPPHEVHLFWPGGSRVAEGGTLEYGANRLQPFTISDDQHVLIKLSDTEHAELLAGEVVVVDPLELGADLQSRGRVDGTDHAEGRRPQTKPGRRDGQSSSGQSSLSAKRDTP